MATFFKWEIAREDLAPLDSEIMELEGDAGLTGPNGDLDGIVIDPVMAKRFEELCPADLPRNCFYPLSLMPRAR